MATAAVLVERATTNALIGPDWAMNLEICDIVNRDPGQAKDVVKAVKKRLDSKNPKVQLLTLTVLETLIKNCGGIVHQQVAEKSILPKMVKIVKKKADMHVKDKILGLLDAWQEAFDGPGGRFPQYYLAYEELRRLGIQFPERALEDGPPVLTPPQTHPVSSYRSPGFGSPSYIPTRLDAPMNTESPQMSLADIETARGGLEVLTEMLNAVNPRDRLAVKDELIVELVEQCRATQSRVRHLVNVTTNEELLRQGLALNDDLQRVLGKHDAIRSGTPLPKEELLPASSDRANGFDHKTDDRKDRSLKSSTQEGQASSSPLVQLALPAPSQSVSSKTSPPTERQPSIDLLSGDVYEDRSPPTPATSPLISQSAGELVLYSPVSEAGNPFVSGPLEAVPPLQVPFNSSDQRQNLQQYPASNGNLQHYASSNGSLQQYPSSNGNLMTQFQAFPQQPYQMYQTNTVGHQSFIPPMQNNYVASWAMAGRQPISSQHNGLVSSPGLQSAQIQPSAQQNGLVSSPGLQSPQIQPPPQQSSYPPAPWNESVPQPISPQQRAMLFGNSIEPVTSPQMQFYSQQQAMSFDQQMRLYPGGAQQNMIGQPQNYSQTYPFQFAQPMGQFSGQFSNQSLVPYTQSPVTPSKPVNPADKLFEDLVDLRKLTSKFKATEISNNLTRPSTSKAAGNV
ncbi:hypothetical protein O6H91_01G053000 [Diphasiastrum complanatum]|uniref:Uncharacterized protein n=8 Tax=Diphasiastrum complanatum TaxID=34168 RepID=A0ACC2EQZ7_DIPCM|nr:hypothetical protein O6H91_01G053000 [Diphasiastrum complanatum]KAJ7568912.1 hypothetical protein O6H91_01G053000 [Diphasiastrum complanatum]KAJ7568913.1 hypothetical protein O6H91_01G053000 [Diphasiastrum complanatum]KAJ7568914.1 hypothetical protein O6H91_01G053000 [Diphasiastrum complanatum]KAJ7568915.1 hypothetical protein O6H91_01G053000 [Diphasiastrum complanatum]